MVEIKASVQEAETELGGINQPFDLLNLLLEENIYVKLRHGRSLTGFLVAYDEHLNLMLTDAVEIVKDENDGTEEST